MPSQLFNIVLSFVLWLSLSIQAQASINISQVEKLEIRGHDLEYLVDPSHELKLNNVSKSMGINKYAWLPGKAHTLNFGYSDSSYWIRFTLQNSSATSSKLFLEINNATLDDIQFHQPLETGGYYSNQTGELYPFSTRPIEHRNFVFPVEIAAYSSNTYYIKIKSQQEILIPLVVHSLPTWQNQYHIEYSLFGSFFGLLFVSILMLATQYSISKNKIYLDFFLYTVLLSFIAGTISGLNNQYIFIDFPHLPSLLNPIIYACAAWLFFRLTRDFTQSSTHSILKWTNKPFIIIIIITIPIALFGFSRIASSLSGSLFAISLIFSFFLLTKSFRKKETANYIYSFSLLLLPLAMLCSSLLAMEWIIYTGIATHLFILYAAIIIALQHQLQENASSQNLLIRRMRELDKIKDEFLANTSHELRTPLNGIIGLSKTLLSGISGKLNPEQYNAQKLISQSAQRLSLLVDDILNYSQLKHGVFKLDIKNIALNQVVENVIGVVLPLASQKNIRIHNLMDKQTFWVKADENRLQQILYNLLGNAIKFTEHGNIEIYAQAHKEEVYVSITDTGIGIDDNELKHIFDAFRQADGSISRSQDGTGLGLSITKKLLELQHGHIEVQSEKGTGTTITFSLPAVPKTEASNIKQNLSDSNALSATLSYTDFDFSPIQEARRVIEKTARLSQESGENITLFAIDDDPVNLKVLETILCGYGYRLITSISDKETENIIEDEKPALLLLDIMIPGTSGYEICTRLRKRYDEIDLPIIMLTAKTQIKDLTQAYACGANDYITKPFESEELLARIHAHLQIQKLVNTLKENEQLRQEISLRKEAEQNLRHTQERLLTLLNIADNGILCFDQSNKLIYCNQYTYTLFGYSADEINNIESQQLILTPLEPILGSIGCQGEDNIKKTDLVLECIHQDSEAFSCEATIHTIPLAEECGYAIILAAIKADNSTQHNVTTQTLDTIEQHEKRMNAVEQSLMSFLEIAQNNPKLLAEAGLQQIENQAPKNAKQNVRDQAVKVMCSALTCWEHEIGKTKLDFAEESGIWPVYIDKSTPTTRTLDKYLNINTAPKNPRSQRVIDSAEFVLRQFNNSNNKNTNSKHDLESELERFREILSGHKNIK